MKKLLFSLLVILTLCICWSVPSLAADYALIDDADVLTPDEHNELSEMLQTFNQKNDIDIIIVTSFYRSQTNAEVYGDNAVVLSVAVSSRDMDIVATGGAKDYFSDSNIDAILDAIEGDMRDDNYADAFRTYIEKCDDRLETGNSFDSVALMYLGISLIIGLVVALIVTGIMAAKLKSVRSKVGATDYVKHGSLNVTLTRDMFLYRTVNRIAKPKQSSGGSHRSRKF